MGSVSLQMAQVARPAEFEAEFAFVDESWSECRGEHSAKVRGESLLLQGLPVWRAGVCVYVRVCVCH